MYVKHRPKHDAPWDPYVGWAIDYGVDLSKPFKVYSEEEDSYVCDTPAGFKSDPTPLYVYLSKDYFHPVASTTNLEDWL